MKLFLSVPPLSEHLPACHCIPVLVFTDPPEADLTATVYPDSGGCTCTCSEHFFGPFRIVWIDKVARGETRLVQIEAATSDGGSAVASCTISRRHDVALKVPVKSDKASYGFPTIVYPQPPPSPVQVAANFTTYGYVNPATAQMSAWVVLSGTTNTISGTAVTPTAPYDWAFSFTGLASGTYTLFVQSVGGGTNTVYIKVP